MINTKILIIDQNQENIELIQNSLNKEQFNLKFTQDFEFALTIIDRWIPLIIIVNSDISSISLPKLLDVLKSKKKYFNTNIILILNKFSKEEYLKGIDKGIFTFLQKPFTEMELRIQIESILRLREVQTKIINEVLNYLKKNLIENIKHESKEYVTKRILESYTKLPDTIRQLKKITDETEESSIKTMEKIDEINLFIFEGSQILDKFKEKHEQLYQDSNLNKVKEILSNIDEYAFEIVNILQFQDITTQQINYTNFIIQNIQKLLRELLAYYSELVMEETSIKIEGTFDPEATIKNSQRRQDEIEDIISSFEQKPIDKKESQNSSQLD